MTERKPKERGIVQPVVDFNKCEAKGPCVKVCPANVFEIRKIADSDRAKLSLVGKMKNWAHGGRVAYTSRADACEACGLCVSSCPERAIKLTRSVSASITLSKQIAATLT